MILHGFANFEILFDASYKDEYYTREYFENWLIIKPTMFVSTFLSFIRKSNS